MALMGDPPRQRQSLFNRAIPERQGGKENPIVLRTKAVDSAYKNTLGAATSSGGRPDELNP